MALSEEQKVTIRSYTGRSGFESEDTTLESVFARIDANPDMQTSVESILETLVAVDAKLVDLLAIVELDTAEESKARETREKNARTMGRMYVARLASLLGVSVLRDVYSAGGAMSFSLPMS